MAVVTVAYTLVPGAHLSTLQLAPVLQSPACSLVLTASITTVGFPAFILLGKLLVTYAFAAILELLTDSAGYRVELPRVHMLLFLFKSQLFLCADCFCICQNAWLICSVLKWLLLMTWLFGQKI